MVTQLPISTLAPIDSAEGRFLAAADNAGDANKQITVAELTSHVAAHPEQADLIGRARIADWTTRIGSANPSPATRQPRVTDLYAGAFSESALDAATRFAQLLKSAGLNVTEIKAIQHNGMGKVTGARISYDTAPTNAGVAAATRTQGVAVNFFGDCIREASRALSALAVADAVVLDIHVTSKFGTGRIAAMRIDYCTRADYERNTTG